VSGGGKAKKGKADVEAVDVDRDSLAAMLWPVRDTPDTRLSRLRERGLAAAVASELRAEIQAVVHEMAAIRITLAALAANGHPDETDTVDLRGGVPFPRANSQMLELLHGIQAEMAELRSLRINDQLAAMRDELAGLRDLIVGP
jgi:hypothetical protein